MSLPAPATIEVTADLADVEFRGGPDNRYAWGRLVGEDTKGRFKDGATVRTSTIQLIRDNLVFTANSVYRVIN